MQDADTEGHGEAPVIADDDGGSSANARDQTNPQMQTLQSEFARRLRDELSQANERMEGLRAKGEHSESLQRKVANLERLIELRGLIDAEYVKERTKYMDERTKYMEERTKYIEAERTKYMEAERSKRMQQLQSEFSRLLHPYAEESGVTRDDIDDQLSQAKERMQHLRAKGKHTRSKGQLLQRRIADFERLVELRTLMMQK